MLLNTRPHASDVERAGPDVQVSSQPGPQQCLRQYSTAAGSPGCAHYTERRDEYGVQHGVECYGQCHNLHALALVAGHVDDDTDWAEVHHDQLCTGQNLQW